MRHQCKATREWIAAGVIAMAFGCAAEATPDAGDPNATGSANDDGDGGTMPDEETGGDHEDTGTPGGPLDGTITYHRDVRPLLQAKCVTCHADGLIAPFALTSYEEVWPLRSAIAAVVAARTMPPWLPGPGCNEYTHDPTLSDEAIATLVGWADEDGPRGHEADYVPPAIDEDIGLSRVDLEVALPVAYTPVQVPDDYRCFLIDWPEPSTTFVTGFRALPDQLAQVHHVIVYAISTAQIPAYDALDAADPEPGYPCFGGPGGTSASAAGRWLGAWAPGGPGGDYPPDLGLRMEPGQKIVVQVHYNTNAAEPVADRTAVQFRLEPEVAREGSILLWTDPDWLEGQMPIPAGEASTIHTFEYDPTPYMSFLTDTIPSDSPFRIYSASHHMHRLGVRGRSEILRSDGSSDCLLDIPRWDFDWQQAFGLAEPLTFQPGDRLRLECEFDNAAGTSDANWGEGTGDEMCLGVFFISPP